MQAGHLSKLIMKINNLIKIISLIGSHVRLQLGSHLRESIRESYLVRLANQQPWVVQ